jgi:hypothetical protein
LLDLRADELAVIDFIEKLKELKSEKFDHVFTASKNLHLLAFELNDVRNELPRKSSLFLLNGPDSMRVHEIFD